MTPKCEAEVCRVTGPSKGETRRTETAGFWGLVMSRRAQSDFAIFREGGRRLSEFLAACVACSWLARKSNHCELAVVFVTGPIGLIAGEADPVRGTKGRVRSIRGQRPGLSAVRVTDRAQKPQEKYPPGKGGR